ncbi:exonuclease subunit SbcD [Oceanobacter kriegii]|uniref:exonuclease subunit SbcD n=1 Tax=Oceanobacter kriegii TaxID=64972 RepID=UPI000427D6A9|nr:exonuclease subunit SbcD [Oceanobacter kriegii]
MNLLHTSDWHLGQNFYTQSRKAEHQQFLGWLLVQVQAHAIDAVIVAGDVFDTGAPPSYARELYNRFIVELNKLNCTLVVLGGNHDSVSTLNESRQLLACLNTYVIAGVNSEDLSDQVLEVRAKKNTERADEASEPEEDVCAIVCAIPFVRPRDVLMSSAGESGDQKRIALGEAISRLYHDIYQPAMERRDVIEQRTGKRVPIIATGHLTALGVKQTESVRDIYIGTLDGFDAGGFPPADYIALGHIHRPQVVAKNECIRYSGSPIPLSFDELKSPKQVVKVSFANDCADGESPKIELLEVPRFQPMAVLKGDLASIEEQLQAFDGEAQTTWLSIEVQSQEFLADLPQRVQALTEGLPVEVLQLKRARDHRRTSLSQQQQETLAELTPQDVFEQRLSQLVFEGDDEKARFERMRTQFRQIVEEIEHEHSPAGGENHADSDGQTGEQKA